MDTEPFFAEIGLAAFNFAPKGWAFCDGTLIPIAQNTALFSLLGTSYGGDGRNTFALPNLQSCSVLGEGQGPGLQPWDVGQSGGQATVTLTASQMPAHDHLLQVAGSAAISGDPAGRLPAPQTTRTFRVLEPAAAMAPATLDTVGSGLAHPNRQPYLVLNFVIALQGVFPQRP